MNVVRAILLIATLTCLGASDRKQPTNVAELFGTAENLEVIKHPEKAEACVLKYFAPPKGGNMREERYEETEYVEVPSELVAAMQAALLRESNYGWDYAKGCWPRFHTRLRFHHGKKAVAIDFCFDCKILIIRRDGEVIGGEDFEDPVFLSAMRQLFPKDAALAKAKN